jgi:alkaline phosphatase D
VHFIVTLFLSSLIVVSCNKTEKVKDTNTDSESDELIIAFGSCARQDMDNKLWKPILENEPSVWIWGGDVIYSDTNDMVLKARHYKQQLSQDTYKEIQNKTKVFGTWDDHDYGLNDGGKEYEFKAESQQLFLDFLGVSENDERRERRGVYYSDVIKTAHGSVNIFVLDTRFFRTALTPSNNPDLRYEPNPVGEGTILGVEQWQWLENELKTSGSDFNLIISSIQFLSNAHGYETWGNMPHEVDKMKSLISSSKAQGVLILSGDRHISEFSKTSIDGLDTQLIDFTSSGLTHSWVEFDTEPNPFRAGEVVSDLSFGLLKFNFKTRTITMQMRGENNVLQQELIQQY